MTKSTQSFESHTAWQPLFHFVAIPVTMLAALHLTWNAIRHPGSMAIGNAVLLWSVSLGIFASRIMALRVQDRVIRLEMRLRLKELLPAAMHPRILELAPRHLVALRFAGDAELPALVERVLKGELTEQKDIKRAITDWQADHLRA